MQDVSMGGLDQDDMYDRQIRLWGHNAQEKYHTLLILEWRTARSSSSILPTPSAS